MGNIVGPRLPREGDRLRITEFENEDGPLSRPITGTVWYASKRPIPGFEHDDSADLYIVLRSDDDGTRVNLAMTVNDGKGWEYI